MDDRPSDDSPDFREVIQAIRDIPTPIASFEDYIDKVLGILHDLMPHYAWTGYYWVKPSGLILMASRGAKEHELHAVGMRRGVIGRAAAMGHTVSDKGAGHFLSEIATPVERFGVVMGVLAVKSDKLKSFSPEHVDFLEKVAQEMSGQWR